MHICQIGRNKYVAQRERERLWQNESIWQTFSHFLFPFFFFLFNRKSCSNSNYCDAYYFTEFWFWFFLTNLIILANTTSSHIWIEMAVQFFFFFFLEIRQIHCKKRWGKSWSEQCFQDLVFHLSEKMEKLFCFSSDIYTISPKLNTTSEQVLPY